MNILANMGEFTSFIWASYAIAAITLGWMFYASWSRAMTLAKTLETKASDTDDNGSENG